MGFNSGFKELKSLVYVDLFGNEKDTSPKHV